jgi:hypothetical protein
MMSMDAPGSTWQPHGDVVYRVDNLGARVGVLPATCLRGDHSLHAVGYRAYQHEGHVQILCNACNGHKPPRPDSYWALRTAPPLPARAELDDGPYRDLILAAATKRS